MDVYAVIWTWWSKSFENENVGVITDYIDATAARMNHKLQLQQKKDPKHGG